MEFVIKRIYEAPAPEDNARILVDRLWPRGVSKQKADLTEWLKDIAPSPALREWFAHESERFAIFREKYLAELEGEPAKQQATAHLLQLGQAGRVTLLYAAKSLQVNHALVLKEYLDKRAKAM
ncbi:DUF488 family protein [Ruminococcaceae bacterium OttesenSCG-928-O06]|nr:DUF488 family protein [Ruminococcaceae bacterium OttesenSCG-928-O06]